MSVGHCLGVFDCLSHVGPQDTRSAALYFSAIERGQGHLSVTSRLRIGHIALSMTFMLLSRRLPHGAPGLSLNSLPRGVENC